MATVSVRPESIHLAAQRVDGAGEDWGASVATLSADMGAVGDPYGGDEVGTALKEMYQVIGPTALEYFTETGFCLIETAAAMNQMATAYTTVDRENAGQMHQVQGILESRGAPLLTTEPTVGGGAGESDRVGRDVNGSVSMVMIELGRQGLRRSTVLPPRPRYRWWPGCARPG